MKINQIIISEMTSGCVASVSKPLGELQKRPDVKGLTPVGTKVKKKGPYANSLLEGKIKELQMDMSTGRDGLSDKDFKKKYGKSKEQLRKELENKPSKEKPVKEAKLDEDDLILIPGQKIKRRTGFVPHGQSRVDHEVSMARSDVLATIKNAKAIYAILKTKSEDEGLEGWVQEKLIKANDYLNSVKEHYDEKMIHQEMTGGVIAGGGVGESAVKSKKRCIQCGMINCSCPGDSCKCKPIKGWIPGKGFKKGVTESKDADEYGNDAFEKWKKYKEYEKEYDKKKPTKPDNKKNKEQGVAEAELDEACWKGYHKEGNKKMFGKTYPNCVKNTNEDQGVAEGKKVDRMIQHIKKSEIESGKSADEAETIAWKTANKRGMLDNKNKIKGK